MTFYHNFTKAIVNLSDEENVAQYLAEGDFIMYSRSGDAILYYLSDEQIKQFAQDWANKIVEGYKAGGDFLDFTTAYNTLRFVHIGESKFRDIALPILESQFKQIK